MATKNSKSAKPAPVKKSTGKSLVQWQERLAQEANIAAGIEENVGQGGSFISTRGGRLAFNGAEIPGNKMNVIVIDHILENHMFAGRYDPDTPQSPVCFAFGTNEDEMKPHEKSSEPQHDICRGCPMNEFGTADTGKGKACKNIRRLAIITEDQLDNIEDAQVAYLKIPVTSVKGWAGYVRQLSSTLQRPPFGVITEISIVPDSKSQFKVQFKLVETIDDADMFEALFAKRDIVKNEIAFPYAPPSEEEEDERPQRGRQSRQQSKPSRTQQSAPKKAAASAGKAGKGVDKGAKRKY